MSFKYAVRSKLKSNTTSLILFSLGLGIGLSCLVPCAQASVSMPQSGSGSGTSRFTNKFIPDAIQHQNQRPHHQRDRDSGSDHVRINQLESFVKDTFRKVVFAAIDVEFGDSPSWSWVANYTDLYWDQLYSLYESKRAKSMEMEQIERNVTDCLDEVGFANKKYCESELVNYLTKEAALRIVAARELGDDMSYVAVGKIAMINEQVFEAPTSEGILAKFFYPLLTLKYFLPLDPGILLTLGLLVGLFIEGDSDSNFSMNKSEFYVMETKKGGSLRQSDVEEYFNKVDISHNGQLSWFEFLLVPTCTMHICFRDLNLPDVNAQPFAAQLKAGDLNQDGFLSMAELSASANGLVLTTEDNEDLVDLDDIFDLFDEDEDGRISYPEIDKVFQDAQMEPLPQFMPMPSGQDGALTREDLAQIASVVQQRIGQQIDVDTMMMMMDKNGNGIIDKNEQQLIANLLKL